MCRPLVKLNTIFNLGNSNVPLKMRERERERERERGSEIGKENRVMGLLMLDCTFPLFFFFLLFSFRVIAYFP